MRNGLIASAAAHAILIGLGLVSLASSAAVDPNIESLPVDLVQVDDTTALPKGSPTAKPGPTHSPSDPAKKVADTPPPPEPAPPPPQAKPTPPVPPPPAQKPADTGPPDPPAPEQTASLAPKPAPTPPPPTPPQDASTPPPQADQPPAPEKKAAATPPAPVPVPHVRPALPSPEKKPNEFNSDKIAALLDKSAPAAPQEASQGPATLGVKIETSSDKMTESEVDALRAQIQRCWTIPVGWTNPEEVTVTIRFRLNADGTVNGKPWVVAGPASQYGPVSGENAIRAVLQCGPYLLPPEKYDQWSEVQLRFSPTG